MKKKKSVLAEDNCAPGKMAKAIENLYVCKNKCYTLVPNFC